MMKLSQLMFSLALILGTLITMSSYSWYSMWMGLEINLLSLIPLLKSNNDLYPAESSLKYFLTQSMASTVILFSIILLSKFNSLFVSKMMMLLMNSAILMKLGAAPFHFWLPEVISGLNWQYIMILLTWQKLAPFVIIFYNMTLNLFFSMIILLSSIISGLTGLNQISLKKIMAYSSINHTGWILSCMLTNQIIWMIYFFIYSIMSILIMTGFYLYKIYNIIQLKFLGLSKLGQTLFYFNFFSLGGLPPFLGFLPKWLVIQNLTSMELYFLSIFLILFSLLALFFYLRISMFTLFFLYQNLTFNKQNKTSWKFSMFNIILLLGLIFTSEIYMFT